MHRGSRVWIAAAIVAWVSPLFAEEPLHAKPERLSGGKIYERVLANRFNSYRQDLHMLSGDRGGHTQSVEMEVKYRNFRSESKKILSKTIAKYNSPQDVRYLGYLVVNKNSGPDDQFVYRPSTRRVRRVNLRGESIVGTDFAFEDIIPQEFEDATYERLPDAPVGGIDCYVVEVTPLADAESEYSRFVSHVQKETFVPLNTQYWDDKGVQIKDLLVDTESIEKFEDEENGAPKNVWVARQSTIRQLKLSTWTRLEIVELEANPGLGKRDFSERQLTSLH